MARAADNASENEAGRHRAPMSALRRALMAIVGVFQTHRNDCRTGRHRFTEPTPIGGGIVRLACSRCGGVSLDLREATVPSHPQLFTGTDERQAFAILRRQVLARPALPPD